MINKQWAIVLSALAIAALSAAPASALEVNYYGSVLGTYIKLDDARPSDDQGYGGAVIGGLDFGSLQLEGILFTQADETAEPFDTDFYQHGVGIDLLWDFMADSALTPFALIGTGTVYNDVVPDVEDELKFYGNVGGGVMAPLGFYNIGVRAEARLFHTPYQDDYDDWRFGIGIVWPLGESEPEPAPAPPLRPLPAPAPKPVPPPPEPPKDSDGDGVIDPQDQCPNTLVGAEVDERGCVVKAQTIKLRGVNFAVNSTELPVNAQAILAEQAEALLGQPSLRVEIAGHTDSQGGENYNRELSQRRAEAVRQFLISQGVAAERLVAVGYGEAEPVADNATAAGRQRNRRTEFRILQQ